MRYLSLPGVDVNISRLVFGMATAWADVPVPASELLDAFVAGGGTTIDTGHAYGDGEGDRAVGRWLVGRRRNDVAIVGKGCHPIVHGSPRVTPQVLHAELTESLDWLGTDFLDVYLLHRDDPSQPVGPIVEALNEERERGRVRVFGVSNWSTDRIDEANAYAAEHGLVPLSVSSPGYSLGIPNEDMWPDCVYVDAAIAQWHRRTQLPMFAWSAQASGFFSGRYAAGDGQATDVSRVYYNDVNFARLERAEQLARAAGVGSNEVALAFVLNQPFPTAAVISARTADQLGRTMAAADLILSEEQIAYLESDVSADAS